MIRAGASLDAGGPWQPRSRAGVPTSVLSRPGRAGVRLPSLGSAKAPRFRLTPQAPLSISEPSLFAPRERAVFDGFFRNRRPSALRKPPPPPVRSSATPAWVASVPTTKRHGQNHFPTHRYDVPSCRTGYTHFSQPIRPVAKPAPAKRRSQNMTRAADQGDLRPLVMPFCHASSEAGALSVRGRQCLLSNQPTVTAGPSVRPRTQLHIFLPTEGAGEAEEMDSESVDEGFMDELDSKFTSLKLQSSKAKDSYTS